jgi:hypothetical protein
VLKKSLHYEQKTSKQFSVTNPFLEKGLEFGPTEQSIERSLKTQYEIKFICETMEFQHRNFETLQENVVFLTQKSNTCHYLMSNCHFDVIYAAINTKYCTL